MEQKVGILLPRSDMFPTLALDFLNALKLSFGKFNTSEVQLSYVVEGIGTASDDTIVRAAEKMILQESVDLVVSFCSLFKLSAFAGVFNAYQKPLIHVNLGGNAIKKEHVSPNVLYHSLNLWQSCYAAGAYAAEKHGKKAAMAASYYDGGYQHSQAFIQGFTENGGEIVNYYVAPMDYKSESFDGLVAGIKESDPEVVLTLFSFKEAAKVMGVLANSELNNKLPIIAIPLQTDETVNKENYGIQNLSSVATWAFDDENPSMQSFVSELKESLKKDPNIMMLMGYEVGHTMATLVSNHGSFPANLSEAMGGVKINSPRGPLTYNAYNESQIDRYLVREFTYNEQGYHNLVIDNIDATSMEDLYTKLEDLPYSGWQNPYICT